MSERGSFTTEYIYCRKCFNAIKPILIKDDKHHKGIVIPSWLKLTMTDKIEIYTFRKKWLYKTGIDSFISWIGKILPKRRGELPIISGKLGGSWSRQELHDFEYFIVPEIEKVICHSLRVAVLAEEGEEIYFINPKKEF